MNVVIGGCMMAAVPQEKMGRISGLNAAIMEASMPIGSFLCSALALALSVTQIFALFDLYSAPQEAELAEMVQKLAARKAKKQ